MLRKQTNFECLRKISRRLGEKPQDPIGETHGDRYGIYVRGSLVIADKDSKRVKSGYETSIHCGDNCDFEATVISAERMKEGLSYVIRRGVPIIRDNGEGMEINFSKVDLLTT